MKSQTIQRSKGRHKIRKHVKFLKSPPFSDMTPHPNLKPTSNSFKNTIDPSSAPNTWLALQAANSLLSYLLVVNITSG